MQVSEVCQPLVAGRGCSLALSFTLVFRAFWLHPLCLRLCDPLIHSSFDCLGFAYRQPQSAGEVLNCDLTDKVNHHTNAGDEDHDVEDGDDDGDITLVVPGHPHPRPLQQLRLLPKSDNRLL